MMRWWFKSDGGGAALWRSEKSPGEGWSPASLTSRWKAGTDRFYRLDGTLAPRGARFERNRPPQLHLDRFEHDA